MRSNRSYCTVPGDALQRTAYPLPEAGRIKNHHLTPVQQFLGASVQCAKKTLVFGPVVPGTPLDDGAAMGVAVQDHRSTPFRDQLGKI